MATSKVSDIVDRAQNQLYDLQGTHWSRNELKNCVNEAVGVAFQLNPDLFAVVEAISLVAGTRQGLPPNGVRFVRVIDHNGRGVLPFNHNAMDAIKPDWHGMAATSTVRQYAPSQTDPMTFWVYPPQTGTGSITVEYIRAPGELSISSSLPFDSRYNQAILDGVLYQAYSKDTEYAGQDGRAAMHYRAFKEGLTHGRNQ